MGSITTGGDAMGAFYNGSSFKPFEWGDVYGTGTTPSSNVGSFLKNNQSSSPSFGNGFDTKKIEGFFSGQDNSNNGSLGTSFNLGGSGGSGSGGNWAKDFMSNYGDMLKFGVGTAMSVGSIYSTLQQLKLAKEAFNFQKETTNTNLNNQTSAYNTELEGRQRGQLASSGLSQEEKDAQVNAYLERHKLVR